MTACHAPTTAAAPSSQRRAWGHWTVLAENRGYKVKRIHVAPGKRLSYQAHEHRSEHWYVLQGRAICTIEGVVRELATGQSTCVDKGAKHRLANPGTEELVVIEVQLGLYTGEDDIVRFEDDFGRVSS